MSDESNVFSLEVTVMRAQLTSKLQLLYERLGLTAASALRAARIDVGELEQCAQKWRRMPLDGIEPRPRPDKPGITPLRQR